MAKLPDDPEKLKEILELSKKITEVREEAFSVNKKNRALLDEVYLLAEKGAGIYEKAIAAANLQLAAGVGDRDRLETKIDLYKELRDAVEGADSANELASKTQLKRFKELSESNTRLQAQTKILGDLQAKSAVKVVTGMKKGTKEIDDFAHSIMVFSEISAKSMMKSFRGAFESVDESLRGYVASTGLYSATLHNMYLFAAAPTAALAKGIKMHTGMLSKLGVASKDIADAMSNLTTNASYYRLALHDTSIESKKTTMFTINLLAHLTKLGLKTEKSTKAIDMFQRALKQTPMMANRSIKSLVSLADSLKIDLNTAVGDFNTLSPELVAYGDDMIEVFADLEVQSQATGIGMSKLNTAALKMDTFEGAAKAAAQLNAALGDNYISVGELLHAEPAEKFEIIKRAVADAGVEFGNLNRFWKRVIKDAGAMPDVEFAARLFGSEDDFELIKKRVETTPIAPEKLAARIEEAMKMSDKMTKALGELAPAMETLVTAGRSVADVLGEMPVGIFAGLNTDIKSSRASLLLMISAGEIFAKKFDEIFGKTLFSLGLLLDDARIQAQIKKFYNLLFPEGLGEIVLPFGLGEINFDDILGTAAEIIPESINLMKDIFKELLHGLDLTSAKQIDMIGRHRLFAAAPTPIVSPGTPSPATTATQTAQFQALGKVIAASIKDTLGLATPPGGTTEATTVIMKLNGEALGNFVIPIVHGEQATWWDDIKTALTLG